MKILLTIIIVFVSSNSVQAGDWFAVDGGVIEIKLDKESMETSLWKYIDSFSDRKFEPRKKYSFQYKVVTEDVIKIHAMCYIFGEVNDDALSKNFIIVDDGGSCFFEISLNLKTGDFFELYVNGEA
ncbi:MAG: hypothetical protein COA86_15095 [Kangiella sp.]|nr:MAG: hypothetical protein COA86_15095 [Kangiella sp.]